MKYRASKLQLLEVSRDEEKRFLNENHHQGYVVSTWCFGLYDGIELIELMSFGTPRYNKKYDWELLRLATKKSCQVYGGASKLLKAFQEKYPLDSIISYCNRDLFDGNVYRALGFRSTVLHKGYHYEKDGKTYHRSNFQKWRCLKLWPQYVGQKITEAQIMKEQGYTRVDDVIGQETFVLNDPIRWYIYEIEINGYHYIGQHKYLEGTDPMEDGYSGSGTIVRRLQDKYGNGKKTILVADIKDQETADRYEKCAIRNSRICYGQVGLGGKNINLLNGGQGYHLISKPRQGWTHSEEARKKMSESRKGVNNSFYGKHHSEETKLKLSEAHRGIPQNISDEVRQQRSEWLSEYNSTRDTTEIAKKISEACKGRVAWNKGKKSEFKWYTNGVEDKLLKECPEGFRPGRKSKPAWNKGKKNCYSEEIRKKMSESAKRRAQRPLSDETRKKLSDAGKGFHWYNNGVETVYLRECPEGFKPGRLK